MEVYDPIYCINIRNDLRAMNTENDSRKIELYVTISDLTLLSFGPSPFVSKNPLKFEEDDLNFSVFNNPLFILR